MKCPNCKADAEHHEINGVDYFGCLGDPGCGWFETNPDGSVSPVDNLPAEQKPAEPEPEPDKNDYQLSPSVEPTSEPDGADSPLSPPVPPSGEPADNDESDSDITLNIKFED